MLTLKEGLSDMKLSTKIGLVTIIILILTNITLYKLYRGSEVGNDRLKAEIIEWKTELIAEANQPPDTIVKEVEVIRDTVIYRDRTVFKDPTPTAKVFEDSLSNDDIDVKVKILAEDVFSIDWEYKPIIHREVSEIHIPKPYPVIKEREVKVDASGLFIDAGIGFSDAFVVGGGITYIDKNRSSYGLKYINHKGSNIYLATYGVNIFRK